MISGDALFSYRDRAQDAVCGFRSDAASIPEKAAHARAHTGHQQPAICIVGIALSQNFAHFIISNSGELRQAPSAGQSSRRSAEIAHFYSLAYLGNVLGIMIAMIFVERWRLVMLIIGVASLMPILHSSRIPSRNAHHPRQQFQRTRVKMEGMKERMNVE